MNKLLLISILLTAGLHSSGQNSLTPEQNEVLAANISDLELDLQRYLHEMGQAKEDVDRNLANEKFHWLLRETLRKEEAFNYPFDSLKMLGRIESPDGAFKLFNWNVANNDFTHKYYCFIVRKTREKDNDVIELFDNSARTANPENKSLDEKKWFGALYYDIIPITKKGSGYYVLLGWDGNNRMTTRKVIETMKFNGKRVQFGLPVFTNGMEQKRRVILEYNADYSVVVRYHKDEKRIVFDHLAPENSELEGIYEFYGPDFTYDAYNLRGMKWSFESNVVVKAEKTRADAFYNDPNSKR